MIQTIFKKTLSKRYIYIYKNDAFDFCTYAYILCVIISIYPIICYPPIGCCLLTAR